MIAPSLSTPPRRFSFLLPSDCERHTGGYVWDRRVVDELVGLGWAVNEHELPPGFPRPGLSARIGSARLLAGLPPDTLVLSESYATSVMPEVLAAETRRLRLISIVHHPLADEGDLAPADWNRLVALERAALAHLTHVIVPSQLTAATLRSRYGVPASRITLAYPGTDTAPLAVGSGSDEIHLLAVGAVSPRKDHLALIESLGTLRALPWRLRVVGSLTRFPDTVSAVRVRAASLGIAHRVELTGECEPDVLAAARKHSDLVVSTSRHEGFGMALAEGIACGLPVVAVASGAIAEWLTADAALLVPPANPLVWQPPFASPSPIGRYASACVPARSA